MGNEVSRKSFRAPFSKGAIEALLKRQFQAVRPPSLVKRNFVRKSPEGGRAKPERFTANSLRYLL